MVCGSSIVPKCRGIKKGPCYACSIKIRGVQSYALRQPATVSPGLKARNAAALQPNERWSRPFHRGVRVGSSGGEVTPYSASYVSHLLPLARRLLSYGGSATTGRRSDFGQLDMPLLRFFLPVATCSIIVLTSSRHAALVYKCEHGSRLRIRSVLRVAPSSLRPPWRAETQHGVAIGSKPGKISPRRPQRSRRTEKSRSTNQHTLPPQAVLFSVISVRSVVSSWSSPKKMLKMKIDPTMCMKTQMSMT